MKKVIVAVLLLHSMYAMWGESMSVAFPLDDYMMHYDLAPAYEPTPEAVADELEALYYKAADQEYIGEAVSQLEHALQAAHGALIAQETDASIDNDVIIAALLHDIGHQYSGKNLKEMDGFGVVEHDKIGAAFLAVRGFSAKIVQLVAGHVDAKRYRVYKDKAYHDALSYASQQTLLRQGGAMSEAEAIAFERNPYFKHILFVRSLDEKAKVVGEVTPTFSFFKTLILEHLKRQQLLKR